ncbi:MAG: hypothetical protein ABI306_00140, partial [Caulobacteraceae bacterium]
MTKIHWRDLAILKSAKPFDGGALSSGDGVLDATGFPSYAGPGVQTSAGATLGVVGGIFTPDAGRLDWGGAGAIPQVWT